MSPRGAAIEQLERRQLLSATYFVSTTGSNSNPGTLAQPFQTIQHAASLAGPGTTIDIMGGVYHETVTPASSGSPGAPITFQAYDGQSVEIDGADPITGWVKYSGNIYKASDPVDLGEGNNEVFVNGTAMTEARWPNNTNLSHPVLAHATSGSGDSVTDPAILSSGVNWVGGIIHISVGQQWVAQTATITSQSGDTVFFHLGYNPPKTGGPTAGNSFYLTGEFAGLKSAGQWFESNGTLYVWAPNGGVPTGVEAKHRQDAFDLDGKSNITINGINIFSSTIHASGSSNITINAIHATYISQFLWCVDGWQPPSNTGIDLTGNNDSITNSVVAYSAGNGIVLYGHGNTATNNVVHDFAYQAYDNAGILLYGTGDTVDNNTIYYGGRDGIKWSGVTGTAIDHNLIHDVMLQTTDGGGIYSYGSSGAGSDVGYNEVYNVNAGGWGAAGLYLDNNDHGYYVHNNYVFDCEYAMKMNPSSLDEKIISNTLIGSVDSIESSGNRDMSGSEFIGNVFSAGVQIGGSVVELGNLSSGNVSGVISAGASISG